MVFWVSAVVSANCVLAILQTEHKPMPGQNTVVPSTQVSKGTWGACGEETQRTNLDRMKAAFTEPTIGMLS